MGVTYSRGALTSNVREVPENIETKKSALAVALLNL